ncbi:MAG: GNAT family N-acetyltransferase [Actinobacteria bacterium]|nr:GNAT family N-acetyltransferase [Actinomycetota bacterium]
MSEGGPDILASTAPATRAERSAAETGRHTRLESPSWGMVVTTSCTDDPAALLATAGDFLVADPVRHNLILTLLEQRMRHPEPGRYWLASSDGEVCGLAMQSPLDHAATMPPMPTDVVDALVDAVAESGKEVPGIAAEAATAAHFAGQWTERTGSAARPDQGQRLYELERLIAPRRTSGRSRSANPSERDQVIEWHEAFAVELGEQLRNHDAVVDRRIAADQICCWDDGGLVAFAGRSAPVAGVIRIGPVYTPPENRGRGYASSLTAAIATDAVAEGHRCILYTDLSNPTSNAIYRALGFRARMEALRYVFT